jgi:flagellar hook assembly protein FlgD
MNVNSVTNNQPKTDTTLNTPSPTVDYNAFLQLLIAQMKNALGSLDRVERTCRNT